MADEAQYEKPTSQLDLERRLDEDYKPPSQIWTSPSYEEPDPDDPEVKGRDMTVEGNELDAYSPGVDPMYKNYANEGEKPYRAEGDDNPEAKAEEMLLPSDDEDGGDGEEEPPPAPEASVAAPRSTARTTKKTSSSS